MYKYIFFDFNGTLLDDCDVCLKVLNVLTKKYNLGIVSKERYKEVFTFPVSNYYKALGFKFSDNEFYNIGNQFHELYNKWSYEEAKIFDSAKTILKKLKNDNYYLICLSASRQDTLEKQLKYYNIYDYFNDVVGVKDALGNSKLDVALKYINNKKFNKIECLFIGDSIHDYEVASSMGINCVLVSTGHTTKERLMTCKCKVIEDLLEIEDIIYGKK